MQLKLSILIRAIDSRSKMLSDLVAHLDAQSGGFDGFYTKYISGCRILCLQYESHEIIIATDDKNISSGAKAQLLLELSVGDYVVWIDEDDWVADYYVSEFLKALQNDVDCVAINGTYTCDGANEVKWYLSKDNPNISTYPNGILVYLRTTNHITAVKRELALKAGFPDKSNAEDKYYSVMLNAHLKTEATIVKPMYEYRYLSTNKQY